MPVLTKTKLAVKKQKISHHARSIEHRVPLTVNLLPVREWERSHVRQCSSDEAGRVEARVVDDLDSLILELSVERLAQLRVVARCVEEGGSRVNDLRRGARSERPHVSSRVVAGEEIV